MNTKLSKKSIEPIEYNGCYKGVAYTGDKYMVEVKESDEGVIVDIFTKDGEELIDTISISNDD